MRALRCSWCLGCTGLLDVCRAEAESSLLEYRSKHVIKRVSFIFKRRAKGSMLKLLIAFIVKIDISVWIPFTP